MAVENKADNQRMVFSETTYKKITRILYELNMRLKARLCVFADMNGFPIDYSGQVEGININSLTAVAAGSFSASNEMSRMISGERHFQHVFHEGEKRNVYMCNISSDYLMIVVFGKQVPIGFVRLLTHHAVGKLSDYLDSLRAGNKQVKQFLDSEFRAKLDRELDKAFGLM